MTRILIVFPLLCALAQPAAAQQDDSLQEGLDLLGEGARLMLRGLSGELLEMMEALSDAMDELEAYELPEVLPNGDILIRRKRPEPPTQPEVGEGGEVEL